MNDLMQERLTRQYERCDLKTLTDFLATTIANVENACLQAGGIPGEDYSFADLLSIAVGIINAAPKQDLELTLADIEPTPTRTATPQRAFSHEVLHAMAARLEVLRASNAKTAMRILASEFGMTEHDAAGLQRWWKKYCKNLLQVSEK